MINNEIWKDISGYFGVYQVSNMGRVRSGMYEKWRMLTPKVTGHGHLMVTLQKDKKSKQILVHRLVAIEFVENPSEYPYVHHVNGKKDQNHCDNLMWCNQSYNIRAYMASKHHAGRCSICFGYRDHMTNLSAHIT